MTNISISVYFTNHLDKVIKLDDNIVYKEAINIEKNCKELYESLSFITNGIHYAPEIVGDFVERILVKIQLDDKPIKEHRFIITATEFLDNDNIKVYAKSKSYILKKNKLNTIFSYVTTKELLRNEVGNIVTLNCDNLIDIPLQFDYKLEDKTLDDMVREVVAISGGDVYYKDGVVVCENKKVIDKDAVPVQTFNEIKDIESFSTTSNKDAQKINTLDINAQKEQVKEIHPKMVLEIKDSPQCCSPDEVKIYTDNDGNTFQINPLNAFFYLYYSPLLKAPSLNVAHQRLERVVIEHYELKDELYLEVTGAIKELIAIDGVDGSYSVVDGFNILTFDTPQTTNIRITYKTDVLAGEFAHSKTEKKIAISAKHFDASLEFVHKYTYNGYYPQNMKHTLNIVSDMGVEYINAINKSVTIAKYSSDTSTYVTQTTLQSDSFGEVTFTLDDYGVYKIILEDGTALYLYFFINRYEKKSNEDEK